MKEKITYLEYQDVKYPLIFTLNVMEEIQQEYGTMNSWMEEIQKAEPSIKALKFGLGSMINEGIDIENETIIENDLKIKKVDLKQVGRIITKLGIENVSNALGSTVVEATKNDDSKNA